MKKVVWPESPYGVCTTRSVPSPAARPAPAARRSRRRGRARWARWARPPRCRAGWSRSWSRGGCAARPAAGHLQAQLLASSSLVSSNMRKTTLPLPPRARDQVGRLLVAEQVVADVLHRLELARRSRRSATTCSASEEVADLVAAGDGGGPSSRRGGDGDAWLVSWAAQARPSLGDDCATASTGRSNPPDRRSRASIHTQRSTGRAARLVRKGRWHWPRWAPTWSCGRRTRTRPDNVLQSPPPAPRRAHRAWTRISR